MNNCLPPTARWLIFSSLLILLLIGCGTQETPTPTVHASTEIAQLPSATYTATATATDPLPTFTAVPSITFTATPGPTRTPGPTPTPTDTPTNTPTATATPTSRPQTYNPVISFETPVDGGFPVSTAIPTAVPTFEIPSGVTNILLLGNDQPVSNEVPRTDTMIIVSINRNNQTASMVSLPRDLYVYIPGWTMGRINTALPHGSAVGYPTGAVGQLNDTILYNFGVPIHYYGQVDFDGFKDAVDAVGGVDIAVSCRLEDWRLKSPELDVNEEDNWERFALEPGIHHMDGDLALWYARSRLTTSDFDRGRRQQQLLRALLNKGLDLDLLPQVPELYETFQDTVDTDMDIGRILQLASLAPAVEENGIQHLYIVGDQLQPWIEPETGAQVQLPVWENMEPTFQALFSPPALNGANRAPIYVEIVNGTNNPELALLAADNLAWYGFVPIIGSSDRQDYETTTVSYYAQNFKASFDWLLSRALNFRQSNIELITDTSYEFNYRIVIGADYEPCTNQLYSPR